MHHVKCQETLNKTFETSVCSKGGSVRLFYFKKSECWREPCASFICTWLSVECVCACNNRGCHIAMEEGDTEV